MSDISFNWSKQFGKGGESTSGISIDSANNIYINGDTYENYGDLVDGSGGLYNGFLTRFSPQSSNNNSGSGITNNSPPCFPENTPILCDQGIIHIEKINPLVHTIRGAPILAITKSIYDLKTIVCFEKNALYRNVPSKDTLMTSGHKVFYNGSMVTAAELVGINDKIYYKKNKYSFVYNVLLEKYDTMVVNNLIVDTLHPESKLAKYYAKYGYTLDKAFEDKMLTMSRTLFKMHK